MEAIWLDWYAIAAEPSMIFRFPPTIGMGWLLLSSSWPMLLMVNRLVSDVMVANEISLPLLPLHVLPQLPDETEDWLLLWETPRCNLFGRWVLLLMVWLLSFRLERVLACCLVLATKEPSSFEKAEKRMRGQGRMCELEMSWRINFWKAVLTLFRLWQGFSAAENSSNGHANLSAKAWPSSRVTWMVSQSKENGRREDNQLV